MAVAETAFVTGLVVPAGVATSLGAFLASQGHFGLLEITLFAAAGALLGDSLGFWIGRKGGGRLRVRKGRLGELVGRQRARAGRLFDFHPLYAVSFARLVAFVRTLMPVTAGTSRMRYHRFVVYDLLGVAGWTAMYVAVGVLAGASWRRVSAWIGTGWAILFVVVGLVACLVGRRRAAEESELPWPLSQVDDPESLVPRDEPPSPGEVAC